MEKKEHNGWYNYETWLANLWFDNDGTSESFREETQRILAGTSGTEEERRQEATRALADVIKSQVEESIPEGMGESGFFADLLNAALSEINYRSIAEHYVDEIVELPVEETSAGE